jgi:phage baseplate assembly protein V
MIPTRLVRALVIAATGTAGKVARIEASGRPGEKFEDREMFQHFGFASRPKGGAECVFLISGGQIISVAEEDRGYRPALAEGEAALFNSAGDLVHLKATGEIEVAATVKVKATAPAIEAIAAATAIITAPSIAANGNVTVTGNLSVTGNISATGTIIDTGGNTPNHDH